MKTILRILSFLGVLFALLILFLWHRYGGGEHFEDRTTAPEMPATVLEKVADLDLPPGNIAVSDEGRIFFTFHPEAKPRVNVVEWVDGRPVPYPKDLREELAYQSVLSLRIDRQNRLWILDNANHGTGTPRILAIDLSTDSMVHHHDFASSIAGIGSHLNDFQVSPDGKMIYIADASIFRKNPALVIYDVEEKHARRVLEGHPSVVPDDYVPVVQGREMIIFGIFAIRPGVDSIALDRKGEWLYFSPVTDDYMHRVKPVDLDDESLSAGELANRVERFALKTMSDGITTDNDRNIYLSDADQSAIVVLEPSGNLRTLIKDPMLRWPDGFSFGPDGWLYVTCSALHEVIMRSRSHVDSEGPYQIYRFKPGTSAPAGH
jgi:sugar lactone lactonase YvrE